MQRIVQTLWATFLIIFPFSLRFVLYEEASYRFGHFNPWVTGFLYAPELFLWAAFLLWAFSGKDVLPAALKKIPRQFKFLVGLFLLNAVILTFWKGDPVLLGFFLLRFAEASMVYFLLRAEVFPFRKTLQFLLWGALFQLLLAFFQKNFNHSVGFTLLGEPVIDPDIAGVAKKDLADGTKQIRPYATFLHPNILAAYFMTLFLTVLTSPKTLHRFLWLALMLGGLYLTGSRAALLVGTAGVFLTMFFYAGKKIRLKSLGLTVLMTLFMVTHAWLFFNSHLIHAEDPSLQARLDQTLISREMIMEEPLGVGISNFTLEMERFSEKKLTPWEFQPVHNVAFLVLNETGVQGLILLILSLVWLFLGQAKKQDIPLSIIPFLSLVLISSFDHFLWDSFAGWVLLALALDFIKVRYDEINPASE